MNHKKLVVGNLKMHMETLPMREAYLEKATALYKNLPQSVDIALCPPQLYIERFAQAFADMPHMHLGAQDCFWELHGSFTGYISPKTLDSLGVEYVILGHSERRALGENDATVNKKCIAALRANLTPIICVGYAEHGEDEMQAITREVQAVMETLSPDAYDSIIFAYEPVWAIGSGKTPTATDIQTMVLFIRQIVGKHDVYKGMEMRVLYGGSVTMENAAEVCVQAHTDGVLVGGASLQPENFAGIIKMINHS